MKLKKKRKLFSPKAARKIALKKPWIPARWNVSIGRRIEKISALTEPAIIVPRTVSKLPLPLIT